MFAFILKLKLLYKVINFDSNNNLCISYGGSQIKMTPQGDIEIKAKRNLINNYELLFQDCDKDFIDDIVDVIKKFIDLKPKGIYHCVGSTSLSPYDLALKIADIFNLNKFLIYIQDSYHQVIMC